ncbi:helix-turn-helix domain-containing protein [Notoacmeibacter marinus]|uniref:helix-turn-helix domain-containing protein n=1 Tax=Notoacmeibacter marinus TaxID=1876515 RepID=UPI000DF1B705|nr:helix-turn-helix domain-containing protein [Notoacmeibacter marinus]
MYLSRPPKPALRPFVSLIWTSTSRTPVSRAGRELVLPTGSMHIAIRLDGPPLRLFEGQDDAQGRTVGASVIGGVRERAYCKEAAQAGRIVGAMIRPGSIELLSRTPAGALAGRHTRLEDLWSHRDLEEVRNRLQDEPTAACRLMVLEQFLEGRLPDLHGIDPLIAHALLHFDRGVPVGDVVADTGFSHRHLARTFADAVGLTPKAYSRLRRFNRALERLHTRPNEALAEIAAVEGYSDQAHMTRDFRAIAGVPPGHYRRLEPDFARHVPVDARAGTSGQIPSRREG